MFNSIVSRPLIVCSQTGHVQMFFARMSEIGGRMGVGRKVYDPKTKYWARVKRPSRCSIGSIATGGI